MTPWRHTWQTWTPNPTVPEKDGLSHSVGIISPHLWVNHHRKNFSTGSSHPSIFAKDLSLGIAIHLVLLSSSTATSVLVLKPQSMHRWFGIAGPLTKDGTHPAPPKKMSYILVVKSHLHPGVFIMAFDIFQGTPILYTSWFYDRIFHGQFQNPHKPWGSVTESDSWDGITHPKLIMWRTSCGPQILKGVMDPRWNDAKKSPKPQTPGVTCNCLATVKG